MQLSPTPPVIPSHLLDRFGEPEEAFGPNMRFRFASFLLGVLLLLIGIAFFLWGLVAPRAAGNGSGGILLLLGGGLMTIGTAAIVFPVFDPLNWVFVCPEGLLRTRNSDWEAVGWADVSRFEDASLSHKAVTIRQCCIVTTAGTEWGFLADWFAEYGRLTRILRQKVEERSPKETRQ